MIIMNNGAAFDNLDSALGASHVETRSTHPPTLTHPRCATSIIITTLTIMIMTTIKPLARDTPATISIFADNHHDDHHDTHYNHDDQPTYGDGHSSHSLPYSFQGATAPYGDSTVYQEVLPSQVTRHMIMMFKIS